MSTFEGIVEEIPGISLDRFDGENLSSSAYFLTHMHTDHIRGLDGEFFRRLRDNNYNLYCTALTKLFLLGKFDLAEEYSSFIRELKPCSPTIVDYVYEGRAESLTVNSVSAGHCPGSVMFIFERENSLVLCTGDFRVSPDDLPKIKALNSYDGARAIPRKFDKIYLDTTFLNPDYAEFPTRRRSLEEVCRIASDWISRGPKFIVSLECPALFGSEFLFMELMEKLGEPTHVKFKLYHDFSRINELSRAVTRDPYRTQIHACAYKKISPGLLPCRRDVDRDKILTVALSAYRWRKRNFLKTISEPDEKVKNRIYVCCSMHPSYNELKAFVEYFEHSEIHPCVDPPADCKVSAADILNQIRRRDSDSEVTMDVEVDVESLMGDRSSRGKFRSKYLSDDSADSL